VGATLYSITLSHPALAARLALERKRVDHRVVQIPAGLQLVVLRAVGFKGGTVPALRIDGRRVQGSIPIMRELERTRAEPRLYPADADARQAVEAAEAWGEAVLQPVPRRIFRWGTANRPELLRWVVSEVDGLPAPGPLVSLGRLPARRLAAMVGATEARVRADLHALPQLLDHVEGLLSGGVIGTSEPSAADLQIGTTVRTLLAFEDLRPLIEERPAGRFARALVPDYPDVLAFLPRDWLPKHG
jgi:glutathione S-transferase